MPQTTPGKSARTDAIRGRLAQARPPPRLALVGALWWGLAMTASLWAGLYVQVDGFTAHRATLTGLYFAGGVLAFPLALFAARFASGGRSAEIRFAASLVALTVATLGTTSALFVLIFWNFYAQWHGESLTPGWIVHFAYAATGVLYQFAVIGTRLYLPLGIVALLVASVWMARRAR